MLFERTFLTSDISFAIWEKYFGRFNFVLNRPNLLYNNATMKKNADTSANIISSCSLCGIAFVSSATKTGENVFEIITLP